MLEAGFDQDAGQYIDLALELTEDPEIISELEGHKRSLESRTIEEAFVEEPEPEDAELAERRDEEAG